MFPGLDLHQSEPFYHYFPIVTLPYVEQGDKPLGNRRY